MRDTAVAGVRVLADREQSLIINSSHSGRILWMTTYSDDIRTYIRRLDVSWIVAICICFRQAARTAGKVDAVLAKKASRHVHWYFVGLPRSAIGGIRWANAPIRFSLCDIYLLYCCGNIRRGSRRWRVCYLSPAFCAIIVSHNRFHHYKVYFLGVVVFWRFYACFRCDFGTYIVTVTGWYWFGLFEQLCTLN